MFELANDPYFDFYSRTIANNSNNNNKNKRTKEKKLEVRIRDVFYGYERRARRTSPTSSSTGQVHPYSRSQWGFGP